MAAKSTFHKEHHVVAACQEIGRLRVQHQHLTMALMLNMTTGHKYPMYGFEIG